MKFSQRIGKIAVRNMIQDNNMDDALKNRLFNVVKDIIETQFTISEGLAYIEKDFLVDFCDSFGEKVTCYDGSWRDFLQKINNKIYTNNEIWFFYDFIEWLYLKIGYHKGVFRDKINSILKQEKSAYIFNNSGELIKMSDEIEIDEVNYSLEKTKKYSSVSEHLKKARDAFSDRENPDYTDTIRESIFAVEAVVKIITNDQNATLESALKNIPNININLKSSLEKLYHFRGDQGGVGHALKCEQKSIISEYDARLVLVTCHAIVNYLILNFLDKNED
jgi:hypothetical protein